MNTALQNAGATTAGLLRAPIGKYLRHEGICYAELNACSKDLQHAVEHRVSEKCRIYYGHEAGQARKRRQRRGFDDFVVNLRRKIGEAMTFLSHCDD